MAPTSAPFGLRPLPRIPPASSSPLQQPSWPSEKPARTDSVAADADADVSTDGDRRKGIIDDASTRTRTPNRTRTLQLQLLTPPSKIPNSLLQQRPQPSEKLAHTDPAAADVDADVSTYTDRNSIIDDAGSFISRTRRRSTALCTKVATRTGNAHPGHRSRTWNRLPSPERSLSSIAYAKRSSVDVGDSSGGIFEKVNADKYDDDDDDDDELGFGDWDTEAKEARAAKVMSV
ncbi:hypothetical protein C0993_007290 [Termitomyces sp. T159_Od127]|nr:hypothetical protein C0993_007290 [Termitomyces sp. T159_Od127]